MANATGLQFTLQAGGGLAADTFAVVNFKLKESVSEPFELIIDLASKMKNIDFGAVLDRPVELKVWHDGKLQRQINGIVCRFAQGDTGFQRTRYQMTVRPAIWRLSLETNSRIFQSKTVQQIITALLDESGIKEVNFQLRHPHGEREYCVQYRETTLAFIQRLAAEEGMLFYHRYTDGRHTIYFADDAVFLPTGPELYFNLHQQTLGQKPFINAFRYEENVRPAKVWLKDRTFKKPDWPAFYQTERDRVDHQRDSYRHYDYPGRFKDQQSGETFTEFRLQALRQDAFQGIGESNCAALMAGLKFALTEHAAEGFNRSWQVIDIEHTGSQPQALEEEGGEGGTTLINQFMVIPHDRTWRPTPNPKPRVDGVQVATVVGPKTEEIFCDEMGRVKVQFPWDLQGKSDEFSSCWIRVAQGWAGGRYGFMAVPRIGHEVLVDFCEGDPDQPIIVGRTYHAVNQPPHTLPANKTRTVFRSESHKGKGFNEIAFEDEANSEFIYLHAQKDHKLDVNHDELLDVGNDRRKKIHHDQYEQVGNDKTTEVIHNHQESVGNDQFVHVMHNQQIQVDNQYLLRVVNLRKETADANYDLKVGGNHKHNVEGEYHLEAKQRTFVHTNELFMQASKKVTIQGPGGKIVIDSSGIQLISTNIISKTPIKVGSGSATAVASLKSAANLGDPLSEICIHCKQEVS